MAHGRYAIFSAQYPPHLGGIESFTQRVAEALARAGHEVWVVTNDTEGMGAARTREGDVEVVRLPCLPLFGGRLPLPVASGRRRALLKEVFSQDWDGVLVNARFYPHSLLGMRLARSQGMAPVVLDHGSDWLSFGNPVVDPLVRLWERALTGWGRLRWHPRYYGISKKSAAWLRTFGITARGVIGNAIDADAFAASSSGRDFRSELGVGDRLMAAFVGRLIPEKGVRSLVEASRDPRLGGVCLVLAGSGPLADEVRAAEGERLRCVGPLGPSDVSALLGQADLLVLPSRAEGFSIVLLEASACGCPSVVTDVGVAGELIGGPEEGTILPSASARDVADALAALAADRGLLARQSVNCARRVREGFSWDATAAALEAAWADAREGGA